jgi:hypothetical protein
MKKIVFFTFIVCMFIMMIFFTGCPQNQSGSNYESGNDSGVNSGNVPGGDLTLYSEAALDGWASEHYVTGAPLPTWTVLSSDVSVNIGDNQSATEETVTRCFISFDLSSIPAGSVIKKAVLRVYQNGTSSGDSYGELWDVSAHLVSYTAFDTASLSGSNWNAASIGTLSTSFTKNTWHELDVLVQLNYELTTSKTGRLQFMLHHTIETNHDAGAPDTDGWVMGDSTINRPELVITTK